MSRLRYSLAGAVIICIWLVCCGSLLAKEHQQSQSMGATSGQRFITIDFDNVDIQLFIKYISELTGKNFVVDKAVQGTVTVLSPTKISEEEAYKVFESVLEVHGFTTVEAGSVIKILPAARARSQNVEMLGVGGSDSAEDRIVTQLVRLKHSSPDDLKKVLAPLVSQTSVLISHAPSGMLIITETQSNIQKLLGIIKVLDVESREEEVAFIPLVNASAEVVAKILTSVYQKSGRPIKSAAITTSRGSVKVVPYQRVNALIVLAAASDLRRVKSLIAVLDTEVQRAEGNIHVYYLQNATATDLAAVLNDLPKEPAKEGDNKGKVAAISKDVQIMADEETNALIIRATKDEYAVLEEVIKKLDIPRRMVYLEALIMEVDVSKNFDVGVEWVAGGSFSGGEGQILTGSRGSSTSSANPLAGISASTAAISQGFTLGVLGQGVRIGEMTFANLGAVANAFKTDSDVNVISTPQILTMDNKKAEISVGENRAFQTSIESTSDTTGRVFNNFEYRDVATKLAITPHINQSDVLRLEIETEVVRIKEEGDTPSTFNRTASTTVVLNDKSTIVIGGIIGHDTTRDDSNVPLLSDIPLLGWLFKSHSTTSTKTNMFIFITPRIVRNPANIAAVTLEKQEQIELSPEVDQDLNKEVNLEHAMTLTRKGYDKLRAGDTDAAGEFFTEALDIDPANPYALMNLGVVYEKEGKPKQAVQMYRSVVAGDSAAVTDSPEDPAKDGVPLKVLAKENIERILQATGGQ